MADPHQAPRWRGCTRPGPGGENGPFHRPGGFIDASGDRARSGSHPAHGARWAVRDRRRGRARRPDPGVPHAPAGPRRAGRAECGAPRRHLARPGRPAPHLRRPRPGGPELRGGTRGDRSRTRRSRRDRLRELPRVGDHVLGVRARRRDRGSAQRMVEVGGARVRPLRLRRARARRRHEAVRARETRTRVAARARARLRGRRRKARRRVRAFIR